MDFFKKYLLNALLYCMAAWPAQSQVRPEIAALAEQLSGVAVTTEPYTNRGIHLKDSTALALQQSATAAELLELTNAPSPVVRTTALLALLGLPGRDSLSLHRLVPEHFHDTATVQLETWAEYRSYLDAEVGEVFLQTVGGYTNSMFWLNGDFRPDSTAQAWLDSVFLCSNTSFNPYKGALVWNWEPTETMYPCIRHLVETGQDNHASIFLAKYQREEDIGLITAHLPEGGKGHWQSGRWQPFQYFQHPEMFVFLKKEMDSSWPDFFYQRMVAKYKDEAAATLLDSIYARIGRLEKKKQWYAVATFSNTIEGDYDPMYAELYLRALTEHPENANFRIPDSLWDIHADTLYRLSLVWKNGGRAERERAMKMMPKVIEYLQANDSDALNAEIVSRIKTGFAWDYYVDHPADLGATMKAFKHIYRTRDPYFIEPLFGFLEKEPLGKNRFFIAKLLLRFDDPAIEGRLIAFFKENPSLAPTLKDAEKGGYFYDNFVYHAVKK